ncbi:MAG: hypothetical protein Q8O08_09770 [Methyloversatilis sp.]|uniref:hypothetical protein n=1 Tax=Methyloversatilis sp. TaxID=2569862 RepID=UPI00273684E6|nr:hypothetical protein [Methyloversatilis sp.]MDP2869104.1 hypothetical protein [Methyloversatilis sp.]
MSTHDLPHDFAPSNRRDFPGRRWLLVALRSAHLVGVVLVGSALLTGRDEYRRAAAALMLLTGLGLYGIEVWSKPRHALELAGLFIPLKLAGVAAMIVLPQFAAGIFWLLLVASSIVSHAPAGFRHLRPGKRS